MPTEPWTIATVLPLLWGAIIAFGVFMYVLMDGFDLGVGILFPFARSDGDRDVMMNTVAPVWDFNETWMVLGGAALLAAFPIAYSIVLPALYLPLTLMLLALIFRGVAFEFRFKAQASKRLWDWAFSGGSIVATLTQGMVLGAFVEGFAIDAELRYAGGALDWLTPFSVMTGVALMAGYGLLGSTWLVMKTEGDLQAWAREAALRFLVGVLAFIAAVSLWVPLLDTGITERWFSWPNMAVFSPVPILVALAAFHLYRAIRRGAEHLPFALAMSLFFLGYSGLAISLWPYVIPHEVTIWEASSSASSQLFLLIGMAFMIPITLIYTAFAYWVFRGKVRPGTGYHH